MWLDLSLSIQGLGNVKLEIPDKWVLAGEHSVSRDFRALALPRNDINLTIEFESLDSGGLRFFPAQVANFIEPILTQLKKEDTWRKLLDGMHGRVFIYGNIPKEGGLGSSAAFCVGLVRLLAAFEPMSDREICALAAQLTNKLHGSSSRFDIAAVFYDEPVSLLTTQDREGLSSKVEVRKLSLKTLPHFTFHDAGLKSTVKDSVHLVEALEKKDAILASHLDEQMAFATSEAEQGLVEYANDNRGQGLKRVANAMRLAHECFKAWGLLPQSVADLEQELLSQGALAVKLTGSGGRGTLVALWPDEKVALRSQ